MLRYVIAFSFVFSAVLSLGCATRWHCPIWLAYLFGINLFTLILFGVDKIAAAQKAHRVSATILLFMSAAGGSPAAWLGQRLWRHKIAKASFRKQFGWVVAIQGVVLGGWIGLLLYWA